MTDEQYTEYCDSVMIPLSFREQDRDHIETLQSYKVFEMNIAKAELRESIIEALPNWIKRFFL